ncbi:MAG: hypothetical protein WC459_01845 [Patescibacteria group bacterium]
MPLLENFKNYLEFLPEGILDAEKKAAQNFGEGDAEKIVLFSKTAYPSIYAYQKIFNTCCRVKEEIGIHKFIKDENCRLRFDKFLREGGDIEKIRTGKIDDEYLSAGDMAAFKEAEAEVHKIVHKETREEIGGSRKDEFENFKKEGEERLRKIEEKIGLLRKMADEFPEWRTEILDKINELEERWVDPGSEPQEIDLTELLEYYGSVLTTEQDA